MRLLQLFEKYESEKCDQKYKLERILLTSIRIGHLTFIVIFKHENVENELMKRVFLFIINLKLDQKRMKAIFSIFKQSVKVFLRFVICSVLGLRNFNIFIPNSNITRTG